MDSSLPSFYLFSIASSVPAAVIDERVYYAERTGRSEGNYIKFHDNLYPLREAMKTDALEDIYKRHSKSQILELEQSFYKNVLREVKRSDEELKKNKVLNFILNDVFPHMRKRAGITDTSKVKIKTPDEDVYSDDKSDPFIESLMKKIRSEKSSTRLFYFDENPEPDYTPTSILGRSLMGTNVLINGEKLYKLTRTMRPSEWNVLLNINDTMYRPSTEILLKNLKDLFAFELERDLKLRFLEEKLVRDAEWKKIKSNVRQLLHAQEYSEKDFGFKRVSDTKYDVFLKVPESVLKDFEYGDYHYFGPTEVCVNVKCVGRQIDAEYVPRTRGRYPHPFTGIAGGDTICMGAYQVEPLKRMDKGKSVARILVDAKGVLLYGYRPGVHPRAHLYLFTSNKITKSEIKRRGLRVTNEIVESPDFGNEYRPSPRRRERHYGYL